jgi:hypothetical protein
MDQWCVRARCAGATIVDPAHLPGFEAWHDSEMMCSYFKAELKPISRSGTEA